LDRLVYTTEICGKIRTQIATLGSADLVLCKMFAPPCSAAQAYEYALRAAHCFDLTVDEFMKKFKELRKSAYRVNAASNLSEKDSHPSGASRSTGAAETSE
jgi:hypothetical protein